MDDVARARFGPLLDQVTGALRADGARGAAVIGSVARRIAGPESDLDVLAVTADGVPASFTRTLHVDLLVEVVAKTEAKWIEHLQSERPRWVYAFRDLGDVFFDDGSVARLRELSDAVYRDFRTPVEVRRELATMLWHGREKLARAAASPDPRQAAYWSAMVVPTLIDALLALANRPTAPGSLRLDVLGTVALDNRDAALVDAALQGDPMLRLAATRELAASLAERLGEPDLERVDW